MMGIAEWGMLGIAIWALSASCAGAYAVTRKRAGSDEYDDPARMVAGLVMGIASGVPAGLVIGNLSFGLVMGAAMGMTLGSLVQYRHAARPDIVAPAQGPKGGRAVDRRGGPWTRTAGAQH
jgi:mannose/fructose/N-acetylgalactosamine-specific phosphotransferase system component IIC